MSSLIFNPFEWNTTNDVLESITIGRVPISYDDYILWPSPKVKDNQYLDAEEISSTIINSCVLIINGDGFHIYKNENGRCHPRVTLPKKVCGKKRICNHITCPKCNPKCKCELDAIKIIKGVYASNIPLVLCGHDCIDRAMTYHEAGFSFTKAFIARNNLLKDSFSDNSNKKFNDLTSVKQEMLSQMVKRMCGSFSVALEQSYNRFPNIYGPQDIYDGICDLENISTYISNQEGYITKDLRNEMNSEKKLLCKCPLLKLKDIEEQEIKREPYEYYMKRFTDNEVLGELQTKLSNFRNNIGGTQVQLRSIEKRSNGTEPDSNLGELTIDMFQEDLNILKTALNDSTTSRFRVCKNNTGDLIWVIHFQMKREEFKWNGVNYKIKNIEINGDCLFTCFIEAGVVSYDLIKFRLEICKELRNNKQDYDEPNQYDEDTWEDICQEIRKVGNWDDDIFDYVLNAISNKLDVNIHIYNFKTMNNGGYEVLNDIPIVIPNDKSKINNIHLRRLDDSHYDLMEPI